MDILKKKMCITLSNKEHSPWKKVRILISVPLCLFRSLEYIILLLFNQPCLHVFGPFLGSSLFLKSLSWCKWKENCVCKYISLLDLFDLLYVLRHKGRPCTDYTACNYTSYNMFLLPEYSFFEGKSSLINSFHLFSTFLS